MRLLKFVGICLIALTASIAQAAPLVRAFETDSLKDIVAAQKGRPFVLVLWGLDCAYCRNSLSALSRAKRKYTDLNVVTVAIDPLNEGEVAEMIPKYLASVGLSNNAWAFGSTSSDQLRYAIDPKWHGETPRSYWFNAAGERVAYSGAITEAVIGRMRAGR